MALDFMAYVQLEAKTQAGLTRGLKVHVALSALLTPCCVKTPLRPPSQCEATLPLLTATITPR